MNIDVAVFVDAANRLTGFVSDFIADPVGRVENAMVTIVLVALVLNTLYVLIGTSKGRFSKEHQRRITESWLVLTKIEQLVAVGEYRQAFHLIRYGVDPYTFEEVILSAFERSGAGIVRNDRYSGDGGIDGKVIFQGQAWLIQAKRYRGHIRLSDLEKHDCICKRRKARGIFVHVGRTGKGSAVASRETGIIVLSGRKLMDFLAGHLTLEGVLHG